MLYPIVRIAAGALNWLIRSKSRQLYGELRFLEDEIEAGAGAADGLHLIARLGAKLKKRANQLNACRLCQHDVSIAQPYRRGTR